METMISVIAEHSIDLDLLPPKANILDIGCRGFLFTQAMRDLGHIVVPVDIDKVEGGAYYQCGITGHNGYCGVKHYPDAQATTLTEGNEIKCYTLAQFSKDLNIKWWDLIKMDVEGSEYEIIMNMEKAIATQLSIEFHLHTGIYGMYAVQEMEIKLKQLGYEAVSHKQSAQHGAGLSFWDSLFTMK